MNRKWVRILVAVIFLFVLLGIGLMVYSSKNSADLFSQTIKNQLNSNREANEELLSNTEDIVVFSVGTAAPLPSSRSQSCTAVFVNGKFFIFDVGDGAVAELENLNLSLPDISAVFLTHLHSDHYIDLPYLVNRSWQMGRTQALPIYGPTGTQEVMTATDALLRIEHQYRVDHHGSDIMNMSSAGTVSTEIAMVKNGSSVVYNEAGIVITAFDVGHEPVSPDFGYAISYKGKKVVLSGDTNKNQNVIKHAENADLLIHEAMLIDLVTQLSDITKEMGMDRNAKILRDITDYHSSNIEAAEVAAEANVKHLVLNHLAPVPDRKVISRMYTQGLSKIFKGEISLANDGNKFIVN